jgi:hypothetical protein
MNATNITLLARSNSAINELRRSGLLGVASQAQIKALLDYHVVQGKIYASDIGNTPQFCPTLLQNTAYANVSGGQVVETQLEDNDNTVVLTSGLKVESKVTPAVSQRQRHSQTVKLRLIKYDRISTSPAESSISLTVYLPSRILSQRLLLRPI